MLDERLSAFLDNECDAKASAAVLAALERNGDTRAVWQRQLWLREALRDANTAPPPDPGFGARVRDALAGDSEPGGESGGYGWPAASAQVVALGARRRRFAGAAGLAAAAGLAGVAVLVGNPFSSLSGPQSLAPANLAASSQTVPTGDPSESTTVSVAGAGGQTKTSRKDPRISGYWSVSDAAVEDRLNDYLIQHNGLARGYGLSGATPSFVRVAASGRDGRE